MYERGRGGFLLFQIALITVTVAQLADLAVAPKSAPGRMFKTRHKKNIQITICFCCSSSCCCFHVLVFVFCRVEKGYLNAVGLFSVSVSISGCVFVFVVVVFVCTSRVYIFKYLFTHIYYLLVFMFMK